MQTSLYLVERYLPGAGHEDAAAAADRSAAAAEGSAVRYIGTTYIPADEACFCEYEARSPEAVAQANERAELPFAWILPAVRFQR